MRHVLSNTWALTVSRMRLAMRNRAFLFFSLIMPLAFLFIWLFSVTDRSARAARERKAFDAQFVQSEIGITLAAEGRVLAEATP